MSSSQNVGGIELEVLRRGAGRPVLLLHGMQPVDARAPFLETLGRHAEIIAPSHPGFGRSARPKDFETVYDLVHFYLEFLDTLPHEKLTLMGFSFGGWLAAELAVKCRHRLDALVFVDAFGIKVSDRETPDILDVFGRAMDQNNNFLPGEVPGDRFTAAFALVPPYTAVVVPFEPGSIVDQPGTQTLLQETGDVAVP